MSKIIHINGTKETDSNDFEKDIQETLDLNEQYRQLEESLMQFVIPKKESPKAKI